MRDNRRFNSARYLEFEGGLIVKSFFSALMNLRCGYAIIHDAKLPLLYDAAQMACQHYFAEMQEIKNKNTTGIKEYGYHNLTHKESFVIRNQNIPRLLVPCIPYIEHLHQLAKQCLQRIALDLGLTKKSLVNLIDKSPLPDEGLSGSLLRIIHYASGLSQKQDACDIHQDLGLLTLVPRATIPALSLYDFHGEGQWIDIESKLKTTDLLIMVGETLSLISNQLYLPCPHRVHETPVERLSLVYQVRVTPSILLQSQDFTTVITGEFHQAFSCTAAEYYQQEIARRTSVNGSY